MDATNKIANPQIGLNGEITTEGHQQTVRVYYADTDFSGVVYHGRYLEFLERGRSDFLRMTGVHHTELADGTHGDRLVWIVRRMEIEYRQPARIDDVLTVFTKVVTVSGARVSMHQEIRRDKTLLIEAKVEAAIVDESGRPKRFPKEWVPLFLPSETNSS
ncbi:tol-pal system-associated acyl-CoA thioesterase [Limoniibacter endophyticus]|uniref:Tol-pal system-associated acyl-CoA thioesterase n=1 Tax=Limoniibacter endophyticus TaxID=1565040 RepID=A0A8J3DU34_9HYPH|nr:tol-pal system-associated acyl-CoA thioesterase [Limoniibacter endophyticus]GHC76754.1 tol-pal system-associated acyl-CoA thioesterase [Limoniibacter endophyticus]